MDIGTPAAAGKTESSMTKPCARACASSAKREATTLESWGGTSGIACVDIVVVVGGGGIGGGSTAASSSGPSCTGGSSPLSSGGGSGLSSGGEGGGEGGLSSSSSSSTPPACSSWGGVGGSCWLGDGDGGADGRERLASTPATPGNSGARAAKRASRAFRRAAMVAPRASASPTSTMSQRRGGSRVYPITPFGSVRSNEST